MQRKENEELLRQMHEKPEETQEDWMEKFTKPSQKPQIVESPTMSPDAFARAFQSQSTPSAPALQPLPEPVRNAASTVLDHHDMNAQKATMDKIASDIVAHGVVTPHDENQSLEPSTAITERTIRHESVDLQPKVEPATNVPLPSNPEPEDEFDL